MSNISSILFHICVTKKQKWQMLFPLQYLLDTVTQLLLHFPYCISRDKLKLLCWYMCSNVSPLITLEQPDFHEMWLEYQMSRGYITFVPFNFLSSVMPKWWQLYKLLR